MRFVMTYSEHWSISTISTNQVLIFHIVANAPFLTHAILSHQISQPKTNPPVQGQLKYRKGE